MALTIVVTQTQLMGLNLQCYRSSRCRLRIEANAVQANYAGIILRMVLRRMIIPGLFGMRFGVFAFINGMAQTREIFLWHIVTWSKQMLLYSWRDIGERYDRKFY